MKQLGSKRSLAAKGISWVLMAIVAAVAIIIIVVGAYAAGLAMMHPPSNSTNVTSMAVSTSSISAVSGETTANSVKIVSVDLTVSAPPYLTFTVNNTGKATDIRTAYLNGVAIHSISGSSQACASKSIPTADDCIAANNASTFSMIVNSTSMTKGVAYSYSLSLANGQTFSGNVTAA